MLVVVLMMAGATTSYGQNFNPNNQQQQEIEVSDSELQTYVKIMQEIRQEQKSSQGKMLKAIKENGLEVKRYQEIARAKRQGKHADMSWKEKKAYQAIQKVMKQEQQKMRKKMGQVLKQYKMERRRYVRISRALQRDKQLQQRLSDIRKEKQ